MINLIIFWNTKKNISNELIFFLDDQARRESVFVSAATFWETALLVKKGKIDLADIHEWKENLIDYSHIKITLPNTTDMIDSTLLPDIHKDPFDRLLIVQANRMQAHLVTCDTTITEYDVQTLWI